MEKVETSAIENDVLEPVNLHEIDHGNNSGNIERSGKDGPFSEDQSSGKVIKDSLNTLIVSLRPCITQAKVHIIHQLSRHIAGLKKKKSANEKEKAKNERKVERFVEEISILKRAKKDVISRWLVVNKKSFADITKQETLTQKFNMKVRVFVRTGEHKAVKKVLDAYRSKHTDWESEVPKALRTLGKKRKKTDPNKQELGIKLVKAAEDASKKVACKDKNVTDNKDTVENNDGNTSSESGGEESDIDDQEAQSDESDNDEGIVNAEGLSMGAIDKDSPEGNSSDSDDEEIFVSSLKNALKVDKESSTRKDREPVNEIQKDSIEKKKGEVLVKVIDLKNADFDTVEGDKDKPSIVKATDSNKNKKSSFFMGGESESEEEKEGEEEDEFSEDALQMREESLRTKFQKEGRAGAGLNSRGGRGDGGRGRGRDRGRGNHSNRGIGRGEFVRGKGRVDYNKEGNRRGDFQRGGRGNSGHSYTSSQVATTAVEKNMEMDSNLHPSWAAKKRANTTITKFEGKKIKFGDDGVSSTKPTSNKPTSKGPEAPTPAEKLHPSWAAKQSQKSSIQTFQGKKVVFGD